MKQKAMALSEAETPLKKWGAQSKKIICRIKQY